MEEFAAQVGEVGASGAPVVLHEGLQFSAQVVVVHDLIQATDVRPWDSQVLLVFGSDSAGASIACNLRKDVTQSLRGLAGIPPSTTD